MIGIVLGPGGVMPSPEEQARIIEQGNRLLQEIREEEDRRDPWARYIRNHGAQVQRLKDTHDLLESFMTKMETGPGTSTELDSGRIKVEIVRYKNWYQEDMEYTWGLTVYLHTGVGYKAHHSRSSCKVYSPASESPTDVLMAYTQALADALAINVLLSSGRPKPKLRDRKVDRHL